MYFLEDGDSRAFFQKYVLSSFKRFYLLLPPQTSEWNISARIIETLAEMSAGTLYLEENGKARDFGLSFTRSEFSFVHKK